MSEAAGGGWPGRLAALAGKYRVLAALAAERDAREAGGEGRFPPAEAAARRAALRRVARRFPGALRELDRLSAAALAARAVAADEASLRVRAEPGAAIPLELALAATYHRELRRALLRKRWVAARQPRVRPAGALPPEVEAAFGRRFAMPPEGAGPALAALLRPPGGRLGAAVLADVAGRFGLSPAEAQRLLFGAP